MTLILSFLEGSSDLLSPIFNRKEKQEEVRKPMSLSERLRQEFGVDDDIDTDSSTDNNKNGRRNFLTHFLASFMVNKLKYIRSGSLALL